jgi:hypothetical protein
MAETTRFISHICHESWPIDVGKITLYYNVHSKINKINLTSMLILIKH